MAEDIASRKNTSLDKFTDLLRQQNKKYALNIYSEGGERFRDTYEKIRKYLQDNKTCRTKLSEVFDSVKLASCDNEKFKDYAHDRFIRFDNFVVSIGTGFEIFQEKQMRENTFSIKNHIYTNFIKNHAELSKAQRWRLDLKDF